jgi:hypothetical protein
MRWKTVILVTALAFPSSAGADTYIKIESHTEGFYSGGTMTPPDDSSNEMWVGDKRLAFSGEGQKIIVDAEKQVLIFVNRTDNTFVETPLPLDLSKLFPAEEAGRLRMFARQGTVRRSEAAKKIGEWDCVSYELNDWIEFEGGKVSEREIQAWVAKDPTFPEEAFDKMFVNLLTLSGLSEDYIEAMLGIEGLQVATEETRYQEGKAIETTTRVVEWVEKEPPAEAYAIPEGATAKEMLSLQDLRN